MKPYVVASIEYDNGNRCVDITQQADGRFKYQECRRDPEDGRGWRYLSNGASPTFDSVAAARQAAAREIGWMKE